MFTNYTDIYGTDDNLRKTPPYTNWMDPVVIFDPAEQKSIVAKNYSPSDGNDDGLSGSENSSLKVDGVTIPILKLNNHVISSSNIISVKLYYDSMFPSIDVCIYDQKQSIQFSDTPGFNNVMTLIMTMPGELTYKKISLDFYITSYSPVGEYIYASGSYKLMPLEQIKLKQIKCANPDCPNEKPSTYEFFWQVATDCKLGFAATDECQNVKDDRYRICRSKKLKEYMKECLEYAGMDENSFFDCWVDLFGYIVLVNVSWLLSVKVGYDMLEIKVNHGKRANMDDTNETEWVSVNRTINNWSDQPSENNLMISSYEEISNNNIYESGATKHYNSWGMAGAQTDINSVDQHDVVMKENSVEGQKYAKNYGDFQRWFFSGIEMSDGIPVLQQRSLRNDFFTKKRSKILKVVMSLPNWGLQRGMLINVGIYEKDPQKKQQMITQLDSYNQDTEGTDNDEDLIYSDETEELMADQLNKSGDVPLINTKLSGMYYIDKMEFDYDKNISQNITQTLYLIQKDGTIETNYGTKTSDNRFSASVVGNETQPEANS